MIESKKWRKKRKSWCCIWIVFVYLPTMRNHGNRS